MLITYGTELDSGPEGRMDEIGSMVMGRDGSIVSDAEDEGKMITSVELDSCARTNARQSVTKTKAELSLLKTIFKCRQSKEFVKESFLLLNSSEGIQD